MRVATLKLAQHERSPESIFPVQCLNFMFVMWKDRKPSSRLLVHHSRIQWEHICFTCRAKTVANPGLFRFEIKFISHVYIQNVYAMGLNKTWVLQNLQINDYKKQLWCACLPTVHWASFTHWEDIFVKNQLNPWTIFVPQFYLHYISYSNF